MTAIATPVTLLNSDLPTGNNIDFSAQLKGAQAQEALKEAKASLSWAVLRTTGDDKTLSLVVPASGAADSICITELNASTLRLQTKKIRTLSKDFDLIVRGVCARPASEPPEADNDRDSSPAKFFVSSINAEVTIVGLDDATVNGSLEGARIKLKKSSDGSSLDMELIQFITNINILHTKPQGMPRPWSFQMAAPPSTPPNRVVARLVHDRPPSRPRQPPSPRGNLPRDNRDHHRDSRARSEVYRLRSGALALPLSADAVPRPILSYNLSKMPDRYNLASP